MYTYITVFAPPQHTRQYLDEQDGWDCQPDETVIVTVYAPGSGYDCLHRPLSDEGLWDNEHRGVFCPWYGSTPWEGG